MRSVMAQDEGAVNAPKSSVEFENVTQTGRRARLLHESGRYFFGAGIQPRRARQYLFLHGQKADDGLHDPGGAQGVTEQAL